MSQEQAVAALTRARTEIVRSGLSFVPGPALLAAEELRQGFDDFARLWFDLPADPYFKGGRPSRFRRHAQLDLQANSGEIRWRPNTGYFQPIEYNPLFGGTTRYFASIDRTRSTELILTAMVRIAAAQIFDLAGPWLVNIHLVRTVGDAGASALPAPEGPHRDGYDFLAIHLVDRDNEAGGETMILDQADNTLHVLRLDAAMDTLYMDDRRYRHDVSPISALGRPCHRDMMLMSYERPKGVE